MRTTPPAFDGLLERVNEATTRLRTSQTVPDDVAELVDGFEQTLRAAAPMTLDADPYLTTMVFAGAFLAEKALRHDNEEARRRELRLALEKVRQALRDIVADRPFDQEAPARDILRRTIQILAASQSDVAPLFGVSTRQLQRWLDVHGSTPAGKEEGRIRVVGQLVNQLRHVFTGPGVNAWFHRTNPVLGVRPIDQLADPIEYPSLVAAARAARAQTA